MIFVAQALPMNGGSTFLFRLTKALDDAGQRCAVLLLRREYGAPLLATLRTHADVFFLSDFLSEPTGRLFSRHFGILAPLRWRDLTRSLSPFGGRVHAMGIFSLLFGLRLAQHAPVALSVGVYHQNEFAFAGNTLFERRSRAAFGAVPAASVVFFNESVRTAYARFFRRDDLLIAPLAPIGVALPQPRPREALGTARIVSVGNLEPFKTYNRHVIGTLPMLARDVPSVRYDIYGRGPEEHRLRALAADLNVADRVHFHGTLGYEKFADTVASADVFVGSGTALLEAAALRRPAIVGIESIDTPETYGFLSAIPDLSYNEAGLDRPLHPIADCLRSVLLDAGTWDTIAQADRAKAEQFSIEHTAACFLALPSEPTAVPKRSFANTIAMGVSLAWLAALKVAGISDSFGSRRNQSL